MGYKIQPKFSLGEKVNTIALNSEREALKDVYVASIMAVLQEENHKSYFYSVRTENGHKMWGNYAENQLIKI